MPRRILLVEDDAAVRRSLSRSLAELYDVALAASAEEALARFSETPPEVVLTDVRMPGMDGVELLRTLRERVPGVDVVVMTAYEDMATVARVMREGAFDFLVKPLKQADLLAVLERAFHDRDTRELAQRCEPARRLRSRPGRRSHGPPERTGPEHVSGRTARRCARAPRRFRARSVGAHGSERPR